MTNTLLKLGSFMHMWISSAVTGSFLHAYCLARTMDLSWGNRPGKELQIVNHKEALKACQKTCQMDHCQAVVEIPGSNLCKNHIWHIQNMCLWKYINFGVVCLNICISLFSLNSAWLFSMVPISTYIPIIIYWDFFAVILMDLASFIKNKTVSGFYEIFYQFHQHKRLPSTHFV